RMLYPWPAVFLAAPHGQMLFDIGQGSSDSFVIGMDQPRVTADESLQGDAFGSSESQVKSSAGLGILADGLARCDAAAKVALQHGFEASGLHVSDSTQAPGSFALPSSSTAIAAVVIVCLVGVVIGSQGRTGPIDLTVRDHGCSGIGKLRSANGAKPFLC